MARKKGKRKWVQAARERMEEKGSVGSFGPATEKNIQAGLRAGGKRAQKANFARNMKRAAAKRRRRRGRRS
jgi:hypothetical protein